MPKFELPPLPYDYAALEPHIDTQTMQIHHDKHHGAYVNNLNAALENYPDLQNKSAEDLIKDLNALPEAIRTAVRWPTPSTRPSAHSPPSRMPSTRQVRVASDRAGRGWCWIQQARSK